MKFDQQCLFAIWKEIALIAILVFRVLEEDYLAIIPLFLFNK